MCSNRFTENLVTEIRNCGFAGDETMLIQKFGNRAIGSLLLAQLDNDIFGWNQILMLRWPGWREVLDRLADIDWIKRGHGVDNGRDIAWTTQWNARGHSRTKRIQSPGLSVDLGWT